MKNIKKTTFIFLAIFISSYTIAQQSETNSDEIKTIFKHNSEKSNGGYGGIMVNYSKIGERDGLLMGAKGGWIINHSFTLGAGGYGFITEPKYDYELKNDYEFSGGYGGILLEPIIGAKKPIHISFPILIGAGGIAYTTNYNTDNNYYDDNYRDDSYEDSDAFFVIEPGVELEINMVKFMRIAIIGSYRYTSNIDLKYKSITSTKERIGSDGMLCGWNIGMSFKFGKF